MAKRKPPTSMLGLWMRLASADEQEQMAQMADTSRGQLYQVATGQRQFSAEKAGLIEAASHAMNRSSKGRLPVIYRSDLSSACASCDYARRCLGELALRADFPLLVEDQPAVEG